MRHLRPLVLSLLLFVTLAAPAHAWTIGDTDIARWGENPTGISACDPWKIATLDSTIPADRPGRVTGWGVQALPLNSSATARLVVLHWEGDGWMVVGTTRFEALTINGLNRFTASPNLSIGASDTIGVEVRNACIRDHPNTDGSALYSSGDGPLDVGARPGPGTTVNARPGLYANVDTNIVDHFDVTTSGLGTAGATGSITVTARDARGFVETGYLGAVRFDSSDTGATLPGYTAFTSADAGVKTFTGVRLKTSGWQSLTAADGSTVAGYASVHVEPGPTSSLRLTAPASATAGDPTSISVAAFDAFGNPTPYGGTANVTGDGVLPGQVALANGQGSFSASFTAARSNVVRVATPDGIASGQASVDVAPGAPTELRLDVPGSVTAGQSFDVDVTVVDAYGNRLRGAGPDIFVKWESRGLSSSTRRPVVDGQAERTVTLTRAGDARISARGADGPDQWYVEQHISVAADAASELRLTGPATAQVGRPAHFGVSAFDPYGNLAAGYTGPLNLGADTDDSGLPSSVAMVDGHGEFDVTFRQSGTRAVRLTDPLGALPPTSRTLDVTEPVVDFAAGPAALAFDPQPVVTSSARQLVTVTNLGTDDLTIGGLRLAGADADDFVLFGGGCAGKTLAPAATCQVSVVFRPGTAGAKTARLEVAGGGLTRQVDLTGSGLSATVLTVSPAAWGFGMQAIGRTSATKAFTVTNSSTAPVTITSGNLTGDDAANFVRYTGGCVNTTLAVGESCTVSALFRPQSAGAKSAQLKLTLIGKAPQLIELSGMGAV